VQAPRSFLRPQGPRPGLGGEVLALRAPSRWSSSWGTDGSGWIAPRRRMHLTLMPDTFDELGKAGPRTQRWQVCLELWQAIR